MEGKMGLKTTLTVTCDYEKCTAGKSGPLVVTYVKEDVESNNALLPEEAKYLVTFTSNGAFKTFCCQLHAAESFLPPGYEAVQKKVIELPKPAEEPANVLPWTRKPDDGIRVISRSESDPVPQADGDNSPDNGPGGSQPDAFDF
jgi:hypothetical protein